MSAPRIPASPVEVNAETLAPLIAAWHPGATVTGCEVKEVLGRAEEVSTAARMRIRLTYGPGSPPLPRDVLLKLALDKRVPTVIYRTETQVYRRLLPELEIEKPVCLAAEFDAERGAFLLILEDLSAKGAFFPTSLKPPLKPEQVARLLDLLATVHAYYWNSPKLGAESDWLGSLTEGASFQHFENTTPSSIDRIVAGSPYHTDLITRIGRDPARLWLNVKAVHRHHERTFPVTLQHGDTGAHNTYHLPDGRSGYYDWQLSVRATWPHDVHYCICTALSVADRRKHEQALVEGYLGRLKALGVTDAPGIDVAMREFGRAIIWGFSIGWLKVPLTHYGLATIASNLERLLAACQDHRTFELADEVTP